MATKQFTAFISYSHKDGDKLAAELQQRIKTDEEVWNGFNPLGHAFPKSCWFRAQK